MADTYRIDTIADMLLVPIDRRAAMFRDLEYGMALHELAFGEHAVEAWAGTTWTDDGSHNVTLRQNGEEVLSLEVTAATPPHSAEDGHGL